MDKLPNELLEHICSFLGDRDLWKVIQLSSSFRRLAMLPYLARFGISEANIQSGTLSLSKSFFLIIVVAGISPIQRLVCDDEFAGLQLGYRVLVNILSATAPIPDIVMYNKHYLVHGPKETAYILSRVPSSATTTLVVATNSLLHVCLSHPRSSPPIRWKSPRWPLGSFRLSPAMIFPVVIFGIPLFFVYLVTGVMTLAVLSMRIYQRVSKPPWPKDERIIEGPGQLEFDDWMRIQSLPEEQLTLVTLADTHCWPKFILRPTPGLTDSAYSAVLASLDLGRHMQWLTVEPKTNLAYADLVALVNRHPHLIHLRIEPDSIRPFSLPRLPIVAAPENNVRVLTAPPPYIPYVLPAVPNVHSISLLFTPLPEPARWMSNLRSATFDLHAYRAALEAIASLPGTHPLTLDFTFRFTAASLPWDVLPSTDLEDSALLPETRLTRVSNIWFHRDGSARFRASDIRSAVRWLGLFPSLQRIGFAPGAVEKIPVAERAALAEAICVACRISDPQNITFNING